MPLYLYFFFCACGSILQMVYASSFIFFFSLVPVAWFCQCSMPLHLYFSFLLCLWLGFANVICLFIDILFYLCLFLGFANVLYLFFYRFLFFCLWLDFANALCLFIYIFFSLLPVPWFSQCSMPLYHIFSFLKRVCLCFANDLCS